MQTLLDFLARHYHWLLFVLLEAVGAVLLFGYNSYQGSVWFSTANGVVGRCYAWRSGVEAYFALGETNRLLTARNIRLEQQVEGLSARLEQLTGDSTLARAQRTEALRGFRLIPARVVANTLSDRDNLITIDRGEADGVRPDMGVVSGSGVVGIVHLVSAHYAVVIPVLNSHSNISCTIRRRGYFGYLHWTGGLRDMAYVDDVPRHAHFFRGDTVVTSGYSSVFPSGVAVGQVRYVFNSPDGLSYRLKVRLATDFARLRDVCVVDNSPMRERIDLLRQSRDSIQNKDR